VQQQIRECSPPDRRPRAPRHPLPPGSIDTHVHVFPDDVGRSPDRGYDPPTSTVDDLRHLHQTLGVDRVVFVQPSVYGTDNSAILDGMAAFNEGTPGRARAVIACGLDVTDDQLAAYDAAGVRGVRLNTDNVGGMPVTIGDVPALSDRIRDLGWHIEFLFPGADIVELLPVLRALTVPVTIGHFAYQRAQDGIAAPGFQSLLDLVRGGNTWVKISGANRVSRSELPPYDDLAPMVDALLDAAGDRIMWGTDWPHPNRYGVNPNDGDLADALWEWVPDAEQRRRILVDTPATLYRF
jgi:2-pyrone-4,6-dicarboxylate lactonase